MGGGEGAIGNDGAVAPASISPTVGDGVSRVADVGTSPLERISVTFALHSLAKTAV